MKRTRMRIGILVALFVTAGSVALGAQEFRVQYAEGAVERSINGRWHAVGPGDAVSRDEELRLGGRAYVELSDGTTTLRLAQPGMYQIENLLDARPAVTASTVISSILERFTRFSHRSVDAGPTVGGARARETPAVAGIEWLGGETAGELIYSGRAALIAGDTASALDYLEEAVDIADPRDEAEAAFYLGYALWVSGEPREALGWLRKHAPDPTTEFYHEHVMALAQTCVLLSMSRDAIALLSDYITAPTRDTELLPDAHLLLAVSHRMNGDPVAARRELEYVRAIAPRSDHAATAALLLDGM
ncbi:MAG: hypothetical protein EA403_17155 [Spirochaetaceae bacterium]|nr:MAG: hypothetical protein EA403_17155 [Spirochaetaceae bacterium]